MRWPGEYFDNDVDALIFGTAEHMANVTRRSRYWYRRRHMKAAIYRVETWRRPSFLCRITHAARGILRGA